jgi:prepilin-type N-terminal cleavage/methylation domain-containing protein
LNKGINHLLEKNGACQRFAMLNFFYPNDHLSPRLKRAGYSGFLNKYGFSLIELLIVIAIIAIVATVAVPNIAKFLPKHDRQKTLARLNALVQLGWQRAISTHTLCRIQVDLNKYAVSLQQESGQVDKQDEPLFAPIKGAYLNSSFDWPPSLEIKQFFIEGFDEISRSTAGNKKTKEVWFFIIPDGLTQNVVINAIDKNDIRGGKPYQFSLVLNPFNAQFEIYDTFQKP